MINHEELISWIEGYIQGVSFASMPHSAESLALIHAKIKEFRGQPLNESIANQYVKRNTMHMVKKPEDFSFDTNFPHRPMSAKL